MENENNVVRCLSEELNKVYREYYENPEQSKDKLCSCLMSYLKPVIKMTLKCGLSHSTNEDVDEVLQITMMAILEKGLDSYSLEKGPFSGYCSKIATNKAVDYSRSIYRKVGNETSDEDLELSSDDVESNSFSSNPETLLIRQSYEMDCKNWATKFLQTFFALKMKPYKLVGSGYSIILSKKYPTRDNKNDLTSAKWALDQLEDCTVEYGANSFHFQVNNWITSLPLDWSDDFNFAMEQEEFGKPIKALIFGEHFNKKSIENWDNSVRNKIKKELIESEMMERRDVLIHGRAYN